MAIKQIEVAVCDFNHKHDTPAVERIEIDVCTTHSHMFADRQPDPFTCPECGRGFKIAGSLKHHMTVKHPDAEPAKPVHAV